MTARLPLLRGRVPKTRSAGAAPGHDVQPSPSPHRLGVHAGADGVDVAVLASHADRVELCLLDPDPAAPGGWSERRIDLHGPEYGVWHAHVPGVRAGQHYGFRTHGRWDPAAGLRHNPAKLLLDPYARGIAGGLELRPEVFGHRVEADLSASDPERSPDGRDSAPYVPHAVVLPGHFYEWWGTPRPKVPWERTVIYEAHVVGLTRRMAAVPPPLRGTYAGLAHPATIEHLRSLGITTLELLPIHAFTHEPHLVQRGLTNYWGYNTLGFFAPHAGYATRAAQQEGPHAVLAELREAIQGLHAAGIEVVLDVVYNHTCEGGEQGPHLSWRGLDNTLYYLHDGSSPARLADVTGCGNTLDFRRPRVVQLALDSLRYWAEELQVDGFRFDLAVTLGRGRSGYDADHPFLVALATDPVLSDRKLIAEPWDIGPGGWRTGQFPAPMAEWNDRFRNAVRTFWLADAAAAAHGHRGRGVRDLATRLAGSADLFGHGDPPLMRGPASSINYVTAHDGFTLADLVAYDHKHNEANGEDNRDGSDDNRSWNHGVEGPVRPDSPGSDVLPLRRRSIRNLLATLVLAAGTPMITAGDELGRTQRGNNNAYCQDAELSWLDWDLAPWRRDLLATTQHLLRLRREHAALRATAFYTGRPRAAGERPDLAWFSAAGAPVDQETWLDPATRTLQMLRTAPPAAGGEDALVVLNGALDPVEVCLPQDEQTLWELAWDSAWEHPDERAELAANGGGDGLHSRGGEAVLMEPLAVRVYLGRPRTRPPGAPLPAQAFATSPASATAARPSWRGTTRTV